jgi:Ca-activated chloride channel family protein
MMHPAFAVPLALLAAPLAAQGWVEPIVPPGRAAAPRVEVVSSSVAITVAGAEARVVVDDRLRNAGGALAEATWLVPLPRDAVFSGFSLWQGEMRLEGEMLDRERAQAIYEAIVRARRDPALLTLAGHGLVRSQVFPIAAGETRRVALRYVQRLEKAGDAVRVRYRLPVPDTRPSLNATATATSRTLVVTVDDARDYAEPWSPTHRISTRREGERYVVTVDGSGGGDMELLLPRRRPLAALSVLAHRPAGEEGYALVALSPAPATAAQALPRDLVLVVDVSGSMAGDKIAQACAGLRQALGTLGRRDRFRVVTFGSAVAEFRRGWTPATREALDDARRFVDALVADGGTNLEGALAVALADTSRDDDERGARMRLALVLTDGLPSVGERDPERLASGAVARLGGMRVLTVGVGHDVNTFLLDRLAQAGRGVAEYVAPGADVEQVMGSMLRRVARPVLTDLRIVAAPVSLTDRQPAQLPDLFDGDELVIATRYLGSGSGPVVIEGLRDGRRERIEAVATFPAAHDGDDFVAKLWATRRIGELTRTARLEGASEAIVRAIRELGLRHGIITEYTAFLVQEPGVVVAGRPMPAAPAMDAAMRGGAAAAKAQTGAVAVQRARASAEAAQVANVVDADRDATRRLQEVAAAAPAGASAVRRAGGRLFVLRAGEWTDAAHRDSVPVVTVAPYSAAWFAVARALPEVARCLGAGETLVVAGKRTSVRVAAGGVAELAPARVAALARAFRGG